MVLFPTNPAQNYQKLHMCVWVCVCVSVMKKNKIYEQQSETIINGRSRLKLWMHALLHNRIHVCVCLLCMYECAFRLISMSINALAAKLWPTTRTKHLSTAHKWSLARYERWELPQLARSDCVCYCCRKVLAVTLCIGTLLLPLWRFLLLQRYISVMWRAPFAPRRERIAQIDRPAAVAVRPLNCFAGSQRDPSKWKVFVKKRLHEIKGAAVKVLTHTVTYNYICSMSVKPKIRQIIRCNCVAVKRAVETGCRFVACVATV